MFFSHLFLWPLAASWSSLSQCKNQTCTLVHGYASRNIGLFISTFNCYYVLVYNFNLIKKVSGGKEIKIVPTKMLSFEAWGSVWCGSHVSCGCHSNLGKVSWSRGREAICLNMGQKGATWGHQSGTIGALLCMKHWLFLDFNFRTCE